MTSNFSFIIVSFSLGFADLVQPLMEKFQYPNNKFQINFNDQKSKFQNRACEISFLLGVSYLMLSHLEFI